MSMDVYGIEGLKTVTVNKRDFEDICISALRYALYRHTYVLDATITFIIENADSIFNERVFGVMLRDIDERIREWSRDESFAFMFQMDYECIKSFKDWMVKYGEEKGYRHYSDWYNADVI